jgi:hypothetical protein
MNGIKLRGCIRGFDSFSVLLDRDGQQQTVFKSAISTIQPDGPFDLRSDEMEERKPQAPASEPTPFKVQLRARNSNG